MRANAGALAREEKLGQSEKHDVKDDLIDSNDVLR